MEEFTSSELELHQQIREQAYLFLLHNKIPKESKKLLYAALENEEGRLKITFYLVSRFNILARLYHHLQPKTILI